MGNIGDPVTPSVPAVGSAGPQFATDINAILTELVARLSAKVPLASISTNSTLNMTGSPITNVGYLTLTDTLVAPGASPVNRVTTFGGNLYYVGPSGAIQLTTGGTLNAAAIGGITGDYSAAGPMQFRYTTATTKYEAYSNFAGGVAGYVRALGFDVAASATSAFFARLLFGGAANKTYTLPPTAPTSLTLPMYMDTSGNMSAGHGAKTYSFAPFGAQGTPLGQLEFNQVSGSIGLQKNVNTSVTAVFPINGIPVGTKLTSMTCDFTQATASSISASFVKYTGGTQIQSASMGAVVGTGFQSISTAISPNITVADGDRFFLSVTIGGNAFTATFHGVNFPTTMPA